MNGGVAAASQTSHWRKFGLLYVALGVIILMVLATFPSDEKAISRSVLAVAHPSSGASLVATLDSNTLQGVRDETISLEATTPPGTRIENMIVCASAPQLTSSNQTSCVPVRVFPKSDISSKRIPTVIHLHPTDSSGSDKILITASWLRYVPGARPAKASDAKSVLQTRSCEEQPGSCYPIAEKMAMTVGPVNLGINKLTRFGARLSRFLKDLTLPILLLVIANWLTSEAAGRDRRREEIEKLVRDEKETREKRDEETRRDIEREQEEQKQIAHILLPKVMRLSGHYYLPIVSNLTWFLRASAVSSKNYSDLVFYLLSFFHVARALKEKEGGIFFKDIAAEKLFAIANNVIRGIVVAECGGETEYMAVLDYLDTWLPPGTKRWPRLGERPASLPEPWINLDTWLARIDLRQLEAIRYLFNVLGATMRYECNEPYAHWYINSLRENLFKLEERIDSPDPAALGSTNTEIIKEFLSLANLYRQGKEQ